MPVIDDAMKINKKVYFINYDIQDPAKTDFYHNRLITKLNEINQQKYFKQDGYQI